MDSVIKYLKKSSDFLMSCAWLLTIYIFSNILFYFTQFFYDKTYSYNLSVFLSHIRTIFDYILQFVQPLQFLGEFVIQAGFH